MKSGGDERVTTREQEVFCAGVTNSNSQSYFLGDDGEAA